MKHLFALIFVLLLCVNLGCSPSSGQPSFDSAAAFELLKKQVDIGPRYPGVKGHSICRDFIISQLKPYADEVTTQDFTQTIDGKELALSNIIARFNPKADSFVLLAAQWESRPIADKEVKSALQSKSIPGANDGASGVAVLLQLAKMFKQQPPETGVVMVFFDGEDYSLRPESVDTMFLGSKYYASHLDKKDKSAIRYGILLDMIGDKNLEIYQEVQSLRAAPDVVKKVWAAAKTLGYEKTFIPKPKYNIVDDHIPLINAGIKCIDIIDFDYGPWHTLDDTVDKCSPDSLRIVGEVVAKVVYQEKTR